MFARLTWPAALALFGAFVVAFATGFVLVPMTSHASHPSLEVGPTVEIELEEPPSPALDATVPPVHAPAVRDDALAPQSDLVVVRSE
ncbi:hypothetical protein [Demequina sp. NBRC 110054]|uniref:hypothetical protein n=1 Tax=Demequina sp. NBRC 110054 TaxID=1570343 RepID=UPI0009FD7612|nr:hypothetical protein [Demequina sp. NBRC 110054]